MILNPPTYLLQANTIVNDSTQPNIDQRSSSWIVAVVSFNEAAAMLDPNKGPQGQGASTADPVVNLHIIDDELMSVNVSNPKSSQSKMASIQIKPIQNWYPSLVAPGDWVFIWMSDNFKQIKYIKNQLINLKTNGAIDNQNALCNDTSGLKFAGRILHINNSNQVAGSGQWVVNQTLECQSFMEFTTSVYYTYLAQAIVKGLDAPAATADAEPFSIMGLNQSINSTNSSSSFLVDIANQFINYYTNADPTSAQFSPDSIIGNYYSVIMGTDPSKLSLEGYTKQKVTGHTQIRIPKLVSTIMGNPTAQYLWELLEVQLGLQQYSNNSSLTDQSSGWWSNFQPDFSDDLPVGPVKQTTIRTKGFVPYRPALWDNQSMWSIFEQNKNSTVNEMYTVMRVNSDGKITPTFVVREKPFSTGLFNQFLPNNVPPDMVLQKSQNSLSNSGPIDVNSAINPLLNVNPVLAQEGINASNFSGGGTSGSLEIIPIGVVVNKNAPQPLLIGTQDVLTARTFFGNLPRWRIDSSIIREYNFSLDESARVNYVQVWGTADGLQFIGNTMSPENFKAFQFLGGNFQVDYPDVARHGLRADIMTSQYDTFISSRTITFAPAWASMNADWKFNGHLKANATLRLNGQSAPICEADNCEVMGMVYHIDSVQHIGSIQNGQKTFETILQLSNGIQAGTLVDSNDIPQYIVHFSNARVDYSLKGVNIAPGTSTIINDAANGLTDVDPISSNNGLDIIGTANSDSG